MTEIGMALSNPLLSDKVRQRLPGYVGVPLPDVQVRITDPDDTKKVLFESKGEQDTGFWAKQEDLPVYSAKADSPMIAGNLQVKGPSVFHSYWNKPEETKKEFQDGTWFKTGDTAAFDPVKNSFKILGRSSVDIIKTGGYKISALEVETKLLESPQVSDCAVLGVPDKIWGQKIVSLVQLTKACEEDAEKLQATEQLKKWCEAKMASYSIPVIFKFVPAIPRNQMGKVNKKELLLNHFNEVPE